MQVGTETGGPALALSPNRRGLLLLWGLLVPALPLVLRKSAPFARPPGFGPRKKTGKIDSGCWLLVVGCWLLVVGCWLLVVGCWLLVVGCWLFFCFLLVFCGFRCYNEIVELGFCMVSCSFPSVAPAFAVVARVARAAGLCVRVVLRPSRHSFSRFVAVCVFASLPAAAFFSRTAARLFSLPFCVLRGLSVSVPCSPPPRPRRLRRPFPGPRGLARLLLCACFVRDSAALAVASSRDFLARFAPASPPPAGAVSAPTLPAGVVSALSSFPRVGFSGGRSVSSASSAAFAACVPAVSGSVFVGCASGLDSLARSAFPSASVFSVSSGLFGSGPAAFARRSAAVVDAVGAGGLWVSFPAFPCPAGLLPCPRWPRGARGSGSWGSLSLAAGSGLACLLFFPAPPADWGFVSLGGGWWFRPAPPMQPELPLVF